MRLTLEFLLEPINEIVFYWLHQIWTICLWLFGKRTDRFGTFKRNEFVLSWVHLKFERDLKKKEEFKKNGDCTQFLLSKISIFILNMENNDENSRQFFSRIYLCLVLKNWAWGSFGNKIKKLNKRLKKWLKIWWNVKSFPLFIIRTPLKSLGVRSLKWIFI